MPRVASSAAPVDTSSAGDLRDQPVADGQDGVGGGGVAERHAVLRDADDHAAEDVDGDDDQAGDGVAAHELLGAVHGAVEVEQHGAIPAGLLADVSEFTMPILANQAWRLSARLRLLERVNPYNVIISNVPGPNVPLYLGGAEMQAYYPVSAIVDGQGLNITVMSYRGTMFFGLVACRELVPDLDVLAGYLREELDEMLAAAEAVTSRS